MLNKINQSTTNQLNTQPVAKQSTDAQKGAAFQKAFENSLCTDGGTRNIVTDSFSSEGGTRGITTDSFSSEGGTRGVVVNSYSSEGGTRGVTPESGKTYTR